MRVHVVRKSAPLSTSKEPLKSQVKKKGEIRKTEKSQTQGRSEHESSGNNQPKAFLENTQQQIHTLQAQIGQILQIIQNQSSVAPQHVTPAPVPQVQPVMNTTPKYVQWHGQWLNSQQHRIPQIQTGQC